MRIFLLALCLGFTFVSKAQTNVLYTEQYAEEFYTIQSNVKLDSTDLELVYELDNILTRDDLFIEECLVFKESYPNKLMVTVILTNGIDRTYFIKRNKNIAKFTLVSQKGEVVYDPN